MKTIENIVDYFTGKDTIKYYNKLIKEHPNKKKEYLEKIHEQIFLGKVIPNLMDLTGLVLSIALKQPPYIGIIGAGEALRYNMYAELNEDKEKNKEENLAKHKK
jgi:hypothetical protein